MKQKERTAIATDKAPQAIGPYSQAVRFGELLLLSGQIALEPGTGQMVGETIEAQTERVMQNVQGVLFSEDLNFSHVLKMTVYLKNISDFTKFNAVYEKFLKAPYPARVTVEVSNLPKNALIEIEATACYS